MDLCLITLSLATNESPKAHLLSLLWKIRQKIHNFAYNGATLKIRLTREFSDDHAHIERYKEPGYYILLVCK